MWEWKNPEHPHLLKTADVGHPAPGGVAGHGRGESSPRLAPKNAAQTWATKKYGYSTLSPALEGSFFTLYLRKSRKHPHPPLRGRVGHPAEVNPYLSKDTITLLLSLVSSGCSRTVSPAAMDNCFCQGRNAGFRNSKTCFPAGRRTSAGAYAMARPST